MKERKTNERFISEQLGPTDPPSWAEKIRIGWLVAASGGWVNSTITDNFIRLD